MGLAVLEMLLGMLEFLLFHENLEVKKDVSLADMRMGGMEATEMKEVFVMHLFCSGITQNVSFFCFFKE